MAAALRRAPRRLQNRKACSATPVAQVKTHFQDPSLGSCWRSCGSNWGQLGFPGKPLRLPAPLCRAGPLRAWPCAPGPLPACSCASDERSFSRRAGVSSFEVPIIAYRTRDLVAAWEWGKTRNLAAGNTIPLPGKLPCLARGPPKRSGWCKSHNQVPHAALNAIRRVFPEKPRPAVTPTPRLAAQPASFPTPKMAPE